MIVLTDMPVRGHAVGFEVTIYMRASEPGQQHTFSEDSVG